MGKLSALVLTIALVSLPSVADACRRMQPNAGSLEQYSSVFVGQVTGLHLEGYENRLLGKPDLVDPELGPLTITNGASPVSVSAAVTRAIQGPASGAVELHLAGCTFDLPQLKERGVFFVLPDGKFTVVAWERDAVAYKAWLTRLGVPQDGR
jgi:hypothetical protein